MSEIPVSQEQMDLEANWQMPPIGVGEQIHYLAQWNNSAKPTPAIVTRVSWRSIEVIFVADGRWTAAVDILHKDDPRLARNQNMQRNGSWDYTGLHKRLLAVEQRLDEIMHGAPGGMRTMKVLHDVALSRANATAEAVAHDAYPTYDNPVDASRPPQEKKKRREFTPEQKAASSQRLRDYHAKKKLERESKLEMANS